MDEATKQYIRDFFKGLSTDRGGEVTGVQFIDKYNCFGVVTGGELVEFFYPDDWKAPTPPWQRVCADCGVLDSSVEMFGDLPYCSKCNPNPFKGGR